MAKIEIKNNLLNFITGKETYNEFIALLNDNFDIIMSDIQSQINSLTYSELNKFFDEFSHPVFEEINYFLEEQNKEIQDKVELLKQFGRPIPESILKNEILESAIMDRKKEIIENYKDVKRYFYNSINNNGYKDIYNGEVSFLTEDTVFDFFAKLYDGLYGRVENKNFEYKIRKSLIVDTVLDKLVGGNNIELENIIANKIFNPTQNLTKNVNPTLSQYNKRLKEVKKLIQDVFPSSVDFSKLDYDMHGKWLIVDGKCAILNKIDNGEPTFSILKNMPTNDCQKSK